MLQDEKNAEDNEWGMEIATQRERESVCVCVYERTRIFA